MDSLFLVVLFHVLTKIHGNDCQRYSDSEGRFSCLYKRGKGCIEIIKMMMPKAWHESSINDCLLEQCKTSFEINSCTKELCRKSLAVCIDSEYKERARDKNINGGEEPTKNGEKNDKKRNKDNTKKIFKLGAIVGISVGITGTIILFLTILITVFICRRRSKKKKRKQQTRLQALDQRLEMANLESSSSSTNKGLYNISTNKFLNTDVAQGEYFVIDPSVTKYDKDLRNRKLPEIERFSSAEVAENVYYEIDEDKIKSSTDMEGVHQKQIEEVRDKDSYHSDQTRRETQSESQYKKKEKQTRLQYVDKTPEEANLERIPSNTNKGGNIIIFTNKTLNTVEAQGEYFVLDPSVTNCDKDLSSQVHPEVTRFSGTEGDKNVYYEIDEDKIESSTDMKGVHQKQIEEVKNKGSYRSDQTKNQTQLGSMKRKRDQLTRLQSLDQVTEMANIIESQSSTHKGVKTIHFTNEPSNTNEAHCEYFVLDPSLTKYDQDLSSRVLPVKRFSVAQGEEKFYNEIDEDKIKSSTDMKAYHQKQIEKDIVIYHCDQAKNETRVGFDNTSYRVTSKVDDQII